jgi:hypothetical protein
MLSRRFEHASREMAAVIRSISLCELRSFCAAPIFLR